MSAATERAPIHVSREIHQQIKITAATEGTSMKALTERLLRLGMVAPGLYAALDSFPGWDALAHYETVAPRYALAAYDAALNPEGDPDD